MTFVNETKCLVEDMAILLQELPVSRHGKKSLSSNLIGPWTINLHGSRTEVQRSHNHRQCQQLPRDHSSRQQEDLSFHVAQQFKEFVACPTCTSQCDACAISKAPSSSDMNSSPSWMSTTSRTDRQLTRIPKPMLSVKDCIKRQRQRRCCVHSSLLIRLRT